MNQDLYWTYALNLIINSFLAFLTIGLFIQLLIVVFRVKAPRFKAILLCIPLLKLGFDPFLYDFKNWALLHQINPLESETGSRILSFQICSPSFSSILAPWTSNIRLLLNNNKTFTIADLAALSIPPSTVKGIVIIIGLVSIILLSFFIVQVIRSMRTLSDIAKKATVCKRPLQNQELIQKICKSNVQLLLSSHVIAPCAFGVFRKSICFPVKLIDRLTHDEFEAIIAHELDHLQWHDGIIRMICLCFSSIFWWIPTTWWVNHMKCNQEMSCDAKIHKFDMAPLNLASAILKTARATKGSPSLLYSTYFVEKSSISKRLQLLLEKPNTKKNKFKWIKVGIVGVIATSIFLGRFWIF